MPKDGSKKRDTLEEDFIMLRRKAPGNEENLSVVSLVFGRSGRWCLAALLVIGALILVGTTPRAADSRERFDMVVSGGAAGCLPNAHGEVKLSNLGPNQQLEVFVSDLAPKTTYTLFVLQLPKAPFGMGWYQGDIETNHHGEGKAKVIGIFSDETFVHAVGPGVGAAPVVHPDGMFPDANINPQTAPIHMFHLGIWFDSTAAAVAAGCPGTQTPFNGDHTAGIQVLNTSNFPNDKGPLLQFAP